MGLDFFQIYYDYPQTFELYDFAIPVVNHDVTEYFENDVIAKLVPQSKADLIGVASWRLKFKREQGSCPFILGDTSLTEEKILSQDADIMNLRPFRQGHQALKMAINWHGKAWENGLKDLKTIIKIPEEIKTPIYENHFIAKREIYQQYVEERLKPLMSHMDSKPEVYGQNSGYISKLRHEPDRIKSYRQKTGREDWPIGVFLLERMFSVWIDDKDFKIVNV